MDFFGRVGVVAIDHHIEVSINFSQEGGHNVSFSLALFFYHFSAGLDCQLIAVIRAVVIKYNDIGAGKLLAKITDNFFYRQFFVIAGDDNGNIEFIPIDRFHSILQDGVVTRVNSIMKTSLR